MGKWKHSSRHFNICTTWRKEINFMPRPLYLLYPLERRVYGPRSRSERGEEKNLCHSPDSKPDSASIQPIVWCLYCVKTVQKQTVQDCFSRALFTLYFSIFTLSSNISLGLPSNLFPSARFPVPSRSTTNMFLTRRRIRPLLVNPLLLGLTISRKLCRCSVMASDNGNSSIPVCTSLSAGYCFTAGPQLSTLNPLLHQSSSV
jgi:hypothetical protein